MELEVVTVRLGSLDLYPHLVVLKIAERAGSEGLGRTGDRTLMQEERREGQGGRRDIVRQEVSDGSVRTGQLSAGHLTGGELGDWRLG